jgi:serine/threonine-protein kinase
VRRYPDDADAWSTLGEVYVHMGFYRGGTVSEALAAFDRAIALDSAYAPAYIHAIEQVTHAHGVDAARPYALEYLRRAPGDVTAEAIRLGLDLADPARAHSPDVVRALERASASVLFKTWLAFMGGTDSGEVAVRVARVLAASPESSAPWLTMATRRWVLVTSLLYRGHLEEATAAWGPWTPGSTYKLADLTPVSRKAPDGAALHLDRLLRAGDLERSQAGLIWWASRRDSRSIRRFERLADSLARASVDPSIREQSVYGVAAARAYLALVRGDSSEALTRFEALPDSLCVGCYSESLTRLLLRSARRQDRAVVETPWPWSEAPMAREVVARLEQARAAERLGERERAISGYRFVAEAWRNADPELRPYVAEARQALARLTSEPRP